MSTENLIEGADKYTTLAEVADEVREDAPEATPGIIASAVYSFAGGYNTAKLGC